MAEWEGLRIEVNFILKGYPPKYYASFKTRIKLLLKKEFITGWFDRKDNKIYIHLTNLCKKYPNFNEFVKHLSYCIAHETIHRIIEDELGRFRAKQQEQILNGMGIGHTDKWIG